MKEHDIATAARLELDRRQFLQYMGAGVAAIGMASIFYSPFAGAQDMSHGANNFYTSDLVTMQKVAFPSLYRMNVAGNLFLPNNYDASSSLPAIVVGHPIQREFYDFYRTPRGEYTPASSSPQLTTHPTLTSNVKFMNFYPFNDIESISPRPMLFISGDQAHSREFSEDAYQRAMAPKELVWVEGAGHVDLYDRVDLIPFDKLTSFFTEHLS